MGSRRPRWRRRESLRTAQTSRESAAKVLHGTSRDPGIGRNRTEGRGGNPERGAMCCFGRERTPRRRFPPQESAPRTQRSRFFARAHRTPQAPQRLSGQRGRTLRPREATIGNRQHKTTMRRRGGRPCPLGACPSVKEFPGRPLENWKGRQGGKPEHEKGRHPV